MAARINIPLTYCSISCVCEDCLRQDNRLQMLTTNSYVADVVIGQ